MAAKGNQIALFRHLIRELRISNGNKPIKENLVFQYVRDQFRQYQVTPRKICRGENEMEHLGRTYLCMLENIRKNEALLEMYKGKGDKTVEESAHAVGLKVTPNIKYDY